VSDLVIDASVAVKWFALEDDTDKAGEVLKSGHALLAPRLIITEVANALARKSNQNLVTPREASEYVGVLPRFVARLLDVDDLIEAALENACSYRHPIYDFIYLEAARRWNTQLLTADNRFLAKISGTPLARFVASLSEWRA
jgi:predicted nucleic acid-binding protein